MMIMRNIAVFILFVFRKPDEDSLKAEDNFCLNFAGEGEITSASCLED